ncbi:hypothetical protein CCACVL1_00965, partial [Corchorus capsularis]
MTLGLMLYSSFPGQILSHHHAVPVRRCHNKLPHAMRFVGRGLKNDCAVADKLVVKRIRIVHFEIAEIAMVAGCGRWKCVRAVPHHDASGTASTKENVRRSVPDAGMLATPEAACVIYSGIPGLPAPWKRCCSAGRCLIYVDSAECFLVAESRRSRTEQSAIIFAPSMALTSLRTRRSDASEKSSAISYRTHRLRPRGNHTN